MSLVNPSFFADSQETVRTGVDLWLIVLIGLCGVIVGPLVLGAGLSRPEWLTIDRLGNVASKQTGILCFRRVASASLNDFTEASIFPISTTWRESIGSGSQFEVALTGPEDKRFSVGRVTLSYDLAREFGQEVATFLGLPLH